MLYGSGVNVMPKSYVLFIISSERHIESQWWICLKASIEYNVRALARDPFATVPPIAALIVQATELIGPHDYGPTLSMYDNSATE